MVVFVSEQPETIWLRDCPHDDQGIIGPVMTATGHVVVACDGMSEAWLDPAAISTDHWVIAEPPAWQIAEGVRVTPHTTRGASRDELPPSWKTLERKDDTFDL